MQAFTCVSPSHKCNFVAPLRAVSRRRQRPAAAATRTLRQPACCSADMHPGAGAARQGSPCSWLDNRSAGAGQGAHAADGKAHLHCEVLC